MLLGIKEAIEQDTKKIAIIGDSLVAIKAIQMIAQTYPWSQLQEMQILYYSHLKAGIWKKKYIETIIDMRMTLPNG